MPIRVVIDIFSGLPNPVVQLEGPEEKNLFSHCAPLRSEALSAGLPTPRPILGYRGLIIEQIGSRRISDLPGAFRVGGPSSVATRTAAVSEFDPVEEYLLKSKTILKRTQLRPAVISRVRREILSARKIALELEEARGAAKPLREMRARGRQTSRCAPLPELEWWNDQGLKQFNNNCYNYSTNYRTDTFAQPGRSSGTQFTLLNCSSVKQAAVRDDLIDAPTAKNQFPSEGDLVALVVAPQFDFHWYRKARDGLWTHKIGSAPATSFDNSGNLIKDPRTANRGPYTQFCGFMVVHHGHIKLR
jgi:hypothetical protein